MKKTLDYSEIGKASRGFSLVEVILAISVFALTIVAVIGLLGPIAQQVRDLQDTKVANSLPAPIREELNRLGFTYFVNPGFTAPANLPATLFATEDGSQVVIASEASDPMIGIVPRNQYFEITVEAATGNLQYNSGDAHVAFKILISWPYHLPTGPENDDFVPVQPEDRRTFEYYTAIVVGEPF